MMANTSLAISNIDLNPVLALSIVEGQERVTAQLTP